jgi:hypothetical protein
MRSQTVQDLKHVLVIWLLLAGFTLADGAMSLYWLHRLLAGTPGPKALTLTLGLSVRILGLGGISLYAFRFFREKKLAEFIAIYACIGLNAGLMLFSMRELSFALYILWLRKLVLFDVTLGEASALAGFGALVCTMTGLIRRALAARPQPPTTTADQPAPP